MNNLLVKHYKGGIYKIICEAQHTEDLTKKFVVYADKYGKVWARPTEMFYGKVVHNGNLVKRFTPVLGDTKTNGG
jgi:hypothetical protein